MTEPMFKAAPLNADERAELAALLRSDDQGADELLGAIEPQAARRALKAPAARRQGRPEAILERRILLACGSAPDVWLARNEVGLGFRRALIGDLCEMCRTASRRHTTHYGLGVGSPDLIGAAGGQAFGLELKAPQGVMRESQSTWGAAAERRGLVVGTVRTVDEARAVIDRARSRSR